MDTQEQILELFKKLEGGNSEMAVGYLSHLVEVQRKDIKRLERLLGELRGDMVRESTVTREWLEKARTAFRELKQQVEATKEGATV